MNSRNCVLAILFVTLASGWMPAQGAPATRTNAQVVGYLVRLEEKQVLGAAEAMPAKKYSFAPRGGEFRGVRTFGEQLKHIAADNYLLGAGILGERPPVDVGARESGPDRVHGKPAILAYLKESFAYMRRAAASVDQANAVIPTPSVSPWPKGTATRLGVAVEDCVHTWDHYGQLVEYLRMNGIVPPESRR